MDGSLALYKNFDLVGALGAGNPPIADGALFNPGGPISVGMGNRCRFLLYTVSGTPYAGITSFELYFVWHADDQRLIAGGTVVGIGPNSTTRFDALEQMDAAGATPDQRVHELKYYTYKIPLTAPPIAIVPPQPAPHFEWELVAPLDYLDAYVKQTPPGPQPAGNFIQLWVGPGANAR